MISDELFSIILNELAIREGSLFNIKIRARSYAGEYQNSNTEFGKEQHKRWTQLKITYGLPQTKSEKQSNLASFAERLLGGAK